MKKTTLIVTTFLLVAGLTVNGQTTHEHGQKSEEQQSTMMQQGGMMQGGMMQPGMMGQRGMGMMQGMMQGGMCPMCGQMMQQQPMKKYMMMVNKLPHMQQQLSLTQDQMEQLIDLQAGFLKQQAKHKASMAQDHEKLQSLLDNMASAAEVKQQMQQCANSRIEMGIAAYETAGKMKAVLTAGQKEQLKNMMMQQGGGMMQQGGGMMQQGQGGMMQ